MEKWALVTGAARRIGRAISQQLHQDGYNIIIHFGQSSDDAHRLASELNQRRLDSAFCVQANLDDENDISSMINLINDKHIPLTLLVNNASAFSPSEFGQTNFTQCQKTLTTNLIAPYLLAQGLFPLLSQAQGLVINLLDIHGKRPLKHHGLYSISKAALEMATLSLAQEMAPKVRVNGIAPGAILWPQNSNEQAQSDVIQAIPLARLGKSEDIAKLVSFLANAPYISGQIIAVDGGRSATGFKGAENIE
ncbi:pteridine reductase [Shewanella surugensis]|uniref:Pteridine reductase n=1 Tax=Shewanella surugensis TaxID=212020 RepID=A0ABT0L759_9GAMM|nr:pteridine reductase [Shewanella surugensis]MCL1123220.1 pteridine reductase [Shewanella surugensis]